MSHRVVPNASLGFEEMESEREKTRDLARQTQAYLQGLESKSSLANSSGNSLTSMRGGPMGMGSLIRGMSSASLWGSGKEQGEEGEEDEEDRAPKWDVERVRMMVKKIFVTSSFGTFYDMGLLILSFVSCAQLIYQTYLDIDNEQDMALAEKFEVAEKVLAVLFGFDWLLQLFLADVKSEFFMSFFSMVDLLTVIPVWFTSRVELEYYTPNMTNYESFIYALNALSTFRVCRVFRVRRFLDKIENDVERMVGEICLVLLVGLVFFAAIIQFLERHETGHALAPDKYHNWLYFAMITITTVGFGDLYPISRLGQMMCMVFIMIAILLVPKMTNDLAEKIKATSPYARMVFKKKGSKHAHVLICGDLSTTQLEELFGELFHDDHAGEVTLTAVVLQPHPPSKEMFKILNDPIFSMSIQYLEGSALADKDLIRSKAQEALAVFIFARKYCDAPDEEDAKVILQQLNITRFVSMDHTNNMPVFCMQLIRPENRRHLDSNRAKLMAVALDKGTERKDDLVVCISELKMGILAKSVLYPGMSVLIFNFLSSFADEDEGCDNEDDGDGDGDAHADVSTASWVQEYQLGCDWEIYSTPLSKFFEGAPFSQLANSLYMKLKIVLIGLRVRHRSGKHASRLVLNPGDWPIPSNDDYEVEGYVIAKNKTDSDLSHVSTSMVPVASSADSKDKQGQMRLSKLSMVAHTVSDIAKSGLDKVGGRLDTIKGGVGFLTKKRVTEEPGSMAKAQRGALAAMQQKHGNRKPKESLQEQDWKGFLQSEQRREARSRQERDQEDREANVRKNYYMRTKPAILDNCLIHGYVTTEVPNIDDHIIIASRDLEYLYDLILPLRSKEAGPCRYIVLLTPTEMSDEVWRKISQFEGILYARGSSLEEKDLRRAGIYRCRQIVVLADGGNKVPSNGRRKDKGLVDVDAVFTYQLVKRMSDRTNVILEIVQEENIAYIDPEHNTSQSSENFKFYPQFAAGRLFNPTLLDTLLIQSYYNPDLINLMNAMLGIDMDNKKNGEGGSEIRQPFKASDMKKNPSRFINSVESSSLHQVSIPDGLSTMTYGAMFQYFSKHHVLPVGLLRGVSHTNKAKGNKMEYVVANPAPDTELETTDKVFVLSTAKVMNSLNFSGKGKVKDSLTEMHRTERSRELKSHHRSVGDIDEDIHNLKDSHKILMSKLNSLSDISLTRLRENDLEIQELRNSMGSLTSQMDPATLAAMAAGAHTQHEEGKASVSISSL